MKEKGELNPILTQSIRLIVVSILSQVSDAGFNYLKEQTQTTQGNLSHQLKKLQEAGYIEISKGFENNYSKTTCRLTEKGRQELLNHVEQLKKYINHLL